MREMGARRAAGLLVLSLVLSLVHGGGKVCDVTQFGAKGDNKTKDTEAFRSAITSCAGGGTILLPSPGQYLTGPFNLTDHQTLLVAQGASLLGSPDMRDYPVVASFPSYQGSRDVANSSCRYGALVGAVGARNVSVVGGGSRSVIDGQGAATWWPAKDANRLRCSRPHLLEFEHCQGVTVDRIVLQNSPFWTVHFVYSDDIRATNVTVLAPHTRGNTDGLNPDSSTNVLIQDCFISNGDDGVALKSGLNEAGIEFGKPTANVTIVNITTEGRGGIAIGSEMSGGIENVTIRDVRLLGERTIHMKTTQGRGGYIRNINFFGVKQSIQLWSSYASGNASGPYPYISGLHFTDCPSCSLGCGKIPNPEYCQPDTFTFQNSCGDRNNE